MRATLGDAAGSARGKAAAGAEHVAVGRNDSTKTSQQLSELTSAVSSLQQQMQVLLERLPGHPEPPSALTRQHSLPAFRQSSPAGERVSKAVRIIEDSPEPRGASFSLERVRFSLSDQLTA